MEELIVVSLLGSLITRIVKLSMDMNARRKTEQIESAIFSDYKEARATVDERMAQGGEQMKGEQPIYEPFFAAADSKKPDLLAAFFGK